MQQDLIPPFPSELISESPLVSAFTALEFGALYALATTYWKRGCVDFPNEDAVLALVARCHARRWYDCRDKLLPVWRVLQPRFAGVYAKRVQIVTERVANGALGLAVIAERRARVRTQTAKPLAEAASDSLSPLVPQTAPNEAKSVANGGISVPKRTLRGVKGALLTD